MKWKSLDLSSLLLAAKDCMPDEEGLPIYSSRSLQNYFAFGYYACDGVTYDSYMKCSMGAI